MLQFKPRSGMFITCVALARPLCASISPSRDDCNCRISLTGFWWRLNKVVLLKDCLACASHSVNEKSWPIRPPSSSRNPETSLKDKACGILKGGGAVRWSGWVAERGRPGQRLWTQDHPKGTRLRTHPKAVWSHCYGFSVTTVLCRFIFFPSVLGPTCPALVAGKKSERSTKI